MGIDHVEATLCEGHLALMPHSVKGTLVRSNDESAESLYSGRESCWMARYSDGDMDQSWRAAIAERSGASLYLVAMRRMRRLTAATIGLLLAGTGMSSAAAAEETTFEATVTELDNAPWSKMCGVSDDGRWVAGVAGPKLEGVLLHDVVTGERELVGTTDSASFLHLSRDGRFVTYASTYDSRGAQLYQYDRDTGGTVELASDALYITNLRVSEDSDLVTWTEQTLRQRSGLGPALGPEHTWVWRRTTDQQVEVTRNLDGPNPTTPFPNKLRPWVIETKNGFYLWEPVTGAEFAFTPPSGLSVTDIKQVSNNGQRILYTRHAGRDLRWSHRIVVATPEGSVIAEQTKRVVAEFIDVRYWASEDITAVMVMGFNSITKPDNDRYVVDLEPHNLLWDVEANTTRKISAAGVSLAGYCGGSSDLRWLIGSSDDWRSPQLLLVDTETQAPTAVDPVVLEGPQLSDQIHRLYQAYFARDADAKGLAFWLRARAGGSPLLTASNSFVDSPEFRSTYGDLDATEFVTLVYDNVLRRSPDQSGLEHWVNAIDNGLSRGEVMLGFSESAEFIDRTNTSTPVAETRLPQIHRMYRAFLQRDADASGLTFWNHEIGQGKTLDDIAAGFVTSAEFVSQYGELSNEEYVDLVYNNVLGRSPESSGRDYWLANLQSGMSRGAMMTAFSESIEFIITTNTLPPNG